MEKKDFEMAINKNLIMHGFRKKSSTWYRECANALQVINLQKSSYGNQYYLNICLVPRGMNIEGLPSPKEEKCPIRIRLGSLFSDEREKIEQIFNLEDNSIADSNRLVELTNVLAGLVFPFLEKVGGGDLKSLIENGLFNNGAVSLAAKKHLGITIL